MFIGCIHTPQGKIDLLVNDLPQEVTLIPVKIKVPPIILNVDKMFTVDSFLIMHQNVNELIVNIFLLPKFKHICSFGREGKGPDEFIHSYNGTCNPVYGKNRGFTIGNKINSINYYRISDIISEIFRPYKIINLPPKLNILRTTANVSDSIIFGGSYGGNMEMFKYNNDEQVLECFKEYPDEFPLMNDEIKTNLYGYYLASKPDNKQIVRIYARQGKIEIFNLETKNHIVILYKDFPTLKENMKLEESSRFLNSGKGSLIFSWRIEATNKYIYACIYNDKYENIIENNSPSRNFIPEIHVFEWSGQLVARLKLTEYYDCYAIDTNDIYLYTCDSFFPDIINRYEMNEIIN